MYGCVSHTGFLSHENSKCEERERHRHQKNKILGILEERNVVTMRKSPKQGLTNAEDLTVMLLDNRDSPYRRLK